MNLQEDCHAHYFLLNARRRCEVDEPAKKQEYDELVTRLRNQIDSWKASEETSHVTVYFRDLENGPIFGLFEQEHFAPASLLKVPIMIALLKEAEKYPKILDAEIGIEDRIPDGQNVFDQSKTLVLGQKYPVREVLRRMIVYSDNSSKELLRNYLEEQWPGIIDQTFIDLGIMLTNADGSNFLTVKSYASLFRSLFNASYLNRDMSQLALKFLSEVEFASAIEAGIPADLTVAHKFGYLETADGRIQLHDCGIVYSPKLPYLVCIMTRGTDANTISSIMGLISEEIFNEVMTRN